MVMKTLSQVAVIKYKHGKSICKVYAKISKISIRKFHPHVECTKVSTNQPVQNLCGTKHT
jgi:hypothetical protein